MTRSSPGPGRGDSGTAVAGSVFVVCVMNVPWIVLVAAYVVLETLVPRIIWLWRSANENTRRVVG